MQNPEISSYGETLSQDTAVLSDSLPAGTPANELSLSDFLADFGGSLFAAVTEQNRPVYHGQQYSLHERVLDGLSRKLFAAQREVVRAVNQQLLVEGKPAAVINAEMGTGKTMMAIAAAAVAHAEGLCRTLVLSPPHLVYKWRREILQTVPSARVWILNGTDTLAKLLRIRAMQQKPDVPEFFILGRVRMRMGFHWRPAYRTGKRLEADYGTVPVFCCPKCGGEILDDEGEPYGFDASIQADLAKERRYCRNKLHGKICGEPLWTLCRPNVATSSGVYDKVLKTISGLPGIGRKGAQKLIN